MPRLAAAAWWLSPAAATCKEKRKGKRRDGKGREGKRRERGRRGTTGKGRKTKEGRNDGRRGEEQLSAAVGSGRLVAGAAVRRWSSAAAAPGFAGGRCCVWFLAICESDEREATRRERWSFASFCSCWPGAGALAGDRC